MSEEDKYEGHIPYNFKVTGGFDVDLRFKAYRAADGNVVGFILPDGRKVSLAVCLVVEDEKGETYITREFPANLDDPVDVSFSGLGFEGLIYNRTDFYPVFEDDQCADYEGEEW